MVAEQLGAGFSAGHRFIIKGDESIPKEADIEDFKQIFQKATDCTPFDFQRRLAYCSQMWALVVQWTVKSGPIQRSEA